MANFFRVIKMANIFLSKWRTFSNLSKWRTFALSKRRTFFMKMANFFLSKWRISFYAYSQNGEFFAVVMKCLKGLTQTSRLFAQIQNSRLLHSKKVHFSPKSIFSGPVAVPEPSQKWMVWREIRSSMGSGRVHFRHKTFTLLREFWTGTVHFQMNNGCKI